MTIDNPCMFGTKAVQHMGNRFDPFTGENTHDLAFGFGRVGQRSQQVEDRARAHFNAGRHHVTHGRVMARCHHEAQIDFL